MVSTSGWLILGAFWLAGSLGAGAGLALLATRRTPGLRFRAAWLFYSGLLAFAAAAALAIALF